jgi:hypothetical protein
MAEGTYLSARRAGLNFGDVCRADFFHDAFVHADSRGLIREELIASFARKKGWGDEPIPYYVPVEKADQGHLLAHGSPHRALCLSDDCLILTALGRDGRAPGGRLLFAPMTAATRDDLDALAEFPAFGRFALRADDVHGGSWIVALRNCFMVDARAVHSALPDLVVLSTTDRTRSQLANQWAACACRRGPIVVEDNLSKVTELFVSAGLAEAGALSLGTAVASIAGAAWAFEGRAIERAGRIADESGDACQALDLIEGGLAALLERIPAAMEALRCARAELTR